MSRKNKQKNYAQRAQEREHSRGKNITPKNASAHDNPTIPHIYTGDKSSAGWDKYKQAQTALMPERLPRDPSKKNIDVFVEGYEDVAFWRGIFDIYESERVSFEINVPPREDLAKGKKVLLGMLPQSSENTLLCVDSDFDYLFGNSTAQSRLVTDSPYMFHTYAYSTENFLCYAPTLHNICVKATKNDARIFDFETFLKGYSEAIYPIFIWYAYSAWLSNENVFTLLEFKSSVKLNYLEVDRNGDATLGWLRRQVSKRLTSLEKNYPEFSKQIPNFELKLKEKGLTQNNVYMFMQGHTLMDNVIVVMLNAVCDKLKLMSNIRITTSTKTGTALKNELSNYNNALRSVRDVMLDNESYRDCPQYKLLQRDIEMFLKSIAG